MPLCGGIDAVRHQKILKQADLSITIIGWHATELAGGNPEVVCLPTSQPILWM
ncbi:hypothetical protein OH492_17505 [Vibrio chagasii]|nr:hypothetical protein [Vibrio chagasii]